MVEDAMGTFVTVPPSDIPIPQPEPDDEPTNGLLGRIAQWLADVAEDPRD
jgi:hypothetical protein